MKFVTHPEHTRNLGAPVGWDHSRVHCGSLSISDKSLNGAPYMESVWVPEGRENLLLALNLADIRLAVFGAAHPPISMVMHQTVTDKTMVQAALVKAAEDLAEYAKDLRMELNVQTEPGGKVTVALTARPS